MVVSTNGHWLRRATGNFIYIGPDHCTKSGAERLAKRLKDYWRARGQDRTFEVYYTGVQAGEPVFGVRLQKSIPFVPCTNVEPEGYFKVGPTPRAKIMGLIRDTLRQFPGVTMDQVLNRHGLAGRGKCAMIEMAARRVCIETVKGAFPHLSTTQLGALFNVDHVTILFAMSKEFRDKNAAKGRARYAREKAALEMRAAA